MHIEKNVFSNVFNTIFSFDDKNKDNPQSRHDKVIFYNRPQLAKDSNGKYPKDIDMIDNKARAIWLNWVKGLVFQDSYVFIFGR